MLHLKDRDYRWTKLKTTPRWMPLARNLSKAVLVEFRPLSGQPYIFNISIIKMYVCMHAFTHEYEDVCKCRVCWVRDKA